MVTGNAHIQVCCLVCSPLDIVFNVLEVEVHQKKGNRASSIVAAYWMLTPVSNRDFAIMIERMGFAHGRSIARVDMHGVRLLKCLMSGMGCITPVVKRNRVVCAASVRIIVLPSAPALQCIIQVAKELFNRLEIDDARSDQLPRAHLFGFCCEFTCLHVWRWSTSEIMSLKLASEFWGLQSKKNWTMKVIVLSNCMWTAHTSVCSDMLL